jgi:hypothetical protein
LVASAFGQLALDTGFDVKIESKIAAASLPRAALMHMLSAMLRARPLVFTRKEINLNPDRIAVHNRDAVIDERLARVLFVAASSK